MKLTITTSRREPDGSTATHVVEIDDPHPDGFSRWADFANSSLRAAFASRSGQGDGPCGEEPTDEGYDLDDEPRQHLASPWDDDPDSPEAYPV